MIYTAGAEDKGKRLDAFLAEKTELSRNAAAKLAESGAVTVFGIRREKKYLLKEGDEVELEIPEAEEYKAEPENIPLDIVYEDDDIIVINKPSGMVVHPAPGNYTGTLVNALLYHCRDSLSGIGGVMRPGIVHRIDKDTSGLLVVAKNDFAHKALSEELSYHGIEREYHALVKGGFKNECGTVNLPIGRHPVDRKKMAVRLNDPSAREAVTHYEVIESYGQITYVRLRLETGRTHQIRVHMAHIGCAVAGDFLYGTEFSGGMKRHALHSYFIEFEHPITNELLRFTARMPDDMQELYYKQFGEYYETSGI